MTKTAFDIMSVDPICVGPDTKVSDAAKIMLSRHYNGLPVVDAEKNLIGIISQNDLVVQHKKLHLPSYFIVLDTMIPLQLPGKFEEELERMTAATVGQAMSKDIATITPETPVDEIASLMVDKKLYSLPVVKDGKLIGIVGKEDVLKILIK